MTAEDKSKPSSPDESHSDDDRDIVIESTDIFQGAREVQIEHGGEVYRLIITRNNKLILHQ